MDETRRYRIGVELTRALLATQMLTRRKDLSDDHASFAEVIERSLLNLKELMSEGDAAREAAGDGQAGRSGKHVGMQ